MSGFVHLHTHSHYSLLEATPYPRQLVEAAARDEQPALALTDHGNLFGAIEFYRCAREAGVKPILGCELNVASRDRMERDPRQPVHHLTVLVENERGWRNLIRLVSRSWLESFYFVPRVDDALLAEHAEGLIALSGCARGELPRSLLRGEGREADSVIGKYREIFGPDRFYVEVMDHDLPLQRRLREGLLEAARRTGASAVLTNDVHTLVPEEAEAREVLMCIASGKTLTDEKRPRVDSDRLYFRTAREMRSLFKGADELCDRAVEIAARCELTLRFDEFHLPRFEVPGGGSEVEFFRRSCLEGAQRRYGRIDDRVRRRLEHEMSVIEEMGFVPYFLIVADFVRFAKERGIPVGPGRGSAAGSIVAYALGITDIDPLAHDLLFERFLNRGRVSMPDIDIDFCRDRRDEVIHYVQEKYGPERVSQIVTFGTLAAKAAVRDTGRVFGLPLATVDRIAKKIPTAVGTRLDDALSDPELTELAESDPQIRRLFDVARSIEGRNRHASTHAAGVVIADRPLEEYVPLMRVQGEVNTQFSMNDLESIGLLKMDFLGLKTLTVLDRAVRLVREGGTDLDLERIPLDDPATFALLARGDTTGVFQLESSGMRELLRKMKPDSFDDIVAILALYRPGPLGSGMVESFVARKHGEEPIEYPHEDLEPILRPTYGVMVYQEQIMRISNVLAGFSLVEADDLRKAMGKKKPEVMERYREKFLEGAKARGVDEETARTIWEQMAYFAGYGFNKSHTVAYGVLTYRTAYLKANHPREFLAACMSVDRGDTDKLAVYLEEARRAGIEVLVPDLNESELDFTIRSGAIRFGLGAIKGVGEKPVEAVLEARRRLGRPFSSVFEVFEEVDCRAVTRAVWEAFVAAGAFDWTGLPRARIHGQIERLMRVAQEVQRDRRAGQLGLFEAKQETASAELPPAPEWPDRERLSREKAALGFYLSDHPLRRHETTLSRFTTHRLGELRDLPDRTEVVVAGIVHGIRERITKKGRAAGKRLAIFRMEGMDEDPIEAVCFAEEYERLRDAIQDDAILLVRGVLHTDREEPSLRVLEATPIEDVLSGKVTRVVLRLEPRDADCLESIREALRRHPGPVPVFLRLTDARGEERLLRCGRRFRVRVDEDLLDELQSLLGKERVSLR